jgi:hypothetical protein
LRQFSLFCLGPAVDRGEDHVDALLAVTQGRCKNFDKLRCPFCPSISNIAE